MSRSVDHIHEQYQRLAVLSQTVHQFSSWYELPFKKYKWAFNIEYQ